MLCWHPLHPISLPNSNVGQGLAEMAAFMVILLTPAIVLEGEGRVGGEIRQPQSTVANLPPLSGRCSGLHLLKDRLSLTWHPPTTPV